ncbi:MAG: hypothetical protein IJB20_05980 [Clostridia bacterium]|nr:hypothetical protein [Clostridia bacterium]
MARGGDEEIFRRNLTLLESAAASLSVIRTGVYHEAAVFAKQKYGTLTPDEIARIYRTQFGNTPVGLVSPDFAQFCGEFTDAGSFGFIDTYADDDENPVDTARIAYMQNTFSDRAYRIFERVFERVAANYYPGFREVCEEVYYGRCSYGILPVSSSADGPLLSFHKLQSKYDLKIALEADVEMNDDTVMRFALLKKGLGTLPGSIPDLCGAWRYMDLSVVITDSMKTGAFLSSCEVFGAKILNITSAPNAFATNDYYGEHPALTLQLDITSADLESLYIFLEASHIRYDVSGIYDILT